MDNFGMLPTGELFLMMPLLTGRPLDEYLHAAGKIGRHHALQVAAQIASALQHAHRHGIVHRDLKPGNVFMERRDDQDKVKLLDFGIAKDARSGDLSGRRGIRRIRRDARRRILSKKTAEQLDRDIAETLGVARLPGDEKDALSMPKYGDSRRGD